MEVRCGPRAAGRPLAPLHPSGSKLCNPLLGATRTGFKYSATFSKQNNKHQGTLSRRVSCFQVQDPDTYNVKVADKLPTIPAAGTSRVLPQLWHSLAEKHGDALALLDPHASPPTRYSFKELSTAIDTFAAGLRSLGLSHGECVSLFSENSARWLVADQGIMACGAADAVRGVSSPLDELCHILEHSGSKGLVVADAAALKRLLPALKANTPGAAPLRAALQFVIVLWGDVPAEEVADAALLCPVLTFDEVIERGTQNNSKNEASATNASPPPTSQDLATLVYTSGTTGNPKGVILTHANIMYQVDNLGEYLDVKPGERTLSLLPPWHIYERSAAYHVLSRGGAQVYTSIRRFKEDLETYPPDHLVCVPLVLDTLRAKVLNTLKKASTVRRVLAETLLTAAIAYTRAQRVINGVDLRFAITPRPALELVKAWLLSLVLAPLNWLAQKLVGAKVRSALGVKGCVISGGGSLAPHLDDFFEAVGVPVLNGWGLTETSPVLACRSARRPGDGNVRGSVGRVIPGTELRVADPCTWKEVGDGEQGVVLARGPGVTPGYFRDQGATVAAFSNPEYGDGWFNTGDLGWKAPRGVAGSRMAGCLVLTGRAKDTIVLSSGENVEPQPIEDAICCSPLIKFAVLVGQGHRSLGALLVPDADALADAARVEGVKELTRAQIKAAMRAALASACSNRVRWERITAFKVLNEPFSVEDGTLTRTMKPRRRVIGEKYAPEIAELETHLR